VAITDHSKALGMTRGFDAGRVRQSVGEIEEVRRQVPGIEVLHGLEVDILADGELDMDDDTLERLDWVIVSLHSSLRQPQDVITQRVLRALDHPSVCAMGHPSGRKIGEREGADLDWERVFARAAERGVPMEINSQPDRVDLSDVNARLAKMLLAGLPRIVRVNVRGSNAGAWLEASVRYALAEARSPRPGGAGVLAKLAEVLFIEVLRLYMNEQGEGRTGWLAGVGDRIVGAALNALHRRPAHAWTLEELASEAATSRSVLAERFQHLVGSSPMQYLTQWRMLLAANLLSGSNAPLARIAEDVGYQTDTAFSRAFRREYGTPPAAPEGSSITIGDITLNLSVLRHAVSQ